MPKRKIHPWFFVKEVVLSIFAISSVGLVFFDWFIEPRVNVSSSTIMILNRIDLLIALVFLMDLLISLYYAKNRKKYMQNNWYFFFAAIPITDAFAEALRGIRVLRLLRIIRAGEHLDVSFKSRRKR